MPQPLPWCVVPRKEGGIRPHADIEEFLAGRRRAVLLDNNVLASDWGLVQIGKIVRLGIRVDFNQGLDARRIARDPEVAELLARVRWLRFLRMAYDTNACGTTYTGPWSCSAGAAYRPASSSSTYWCATTSTRRCGASGS